MYGYDIETKAQSFRFSTIEESTSTTDENVEAVKKIILDNHRITITEVANDVGGITNRLMPSNFYACFRQRAAAKIVPNC